jgi:4-hydroxy-2-oxoheptanedioate aldolase
MKNAIKQKIASGGHALGTFFELGGIAAARCMGIAGLDFFIVDTEHGPYDVESALAVIAGVGSEKTTPFIRVKDSTRPSVLKMLDIGAKGIIVPGVQSVEEVEKLVEYAKYYPLGRRGFAPTLAGSYGYADFAANTETYFSVSNAETWLIPQCETEGCLENIEKIAGLEGVDGIFIGPYDLSVALGKPAQMDNPALIEAIAHILQVCQQKGKISMIYAGDAFGVKKFFNQGFDCVACGMDSIFLIEAYRRLISQVNA